MHTTRWLPLLLTGLTGCATFYDPASVRQNEAMEQQRQEAEQERYDRIRSHVTSLQEEVQALRQEVARLSRDAGGATAARLQTMEQSIADLGRRVEAEGAARERDRKNMIDTVSKIIASSGKSSSNSRSTTSAPRKTPTEGYLHKVENGQTISAIAAAYKTTTAAILSANNISNPNSIRVGQELIIPAP